MDVGTVLAAVQVLFAALQCLELRELCSRLGLDYQLQLDDLCETMTTVKAVLLDAEAKQELSHEAQLYMEGLKDAVFDAEDLLDKFVTRAKKKHKKFKVDGKISEKLTSFFSGIQNFSTMPQVKEIRKKLNDIASNHKKFKLDSQFIPRRRKETWSYVNQKSIIGRDDDLKNLVSMVLDSNVKRNNVSFLSIVGIGGLGKTALAQLVFNDTRIKGEFPLRLWVCVSDQDQKQFNVGAILLKILESAAGRKNDGSIMDEVQRQLRKELVANKYLLVLDDVWTEKRHEWTELEDFLEGS